MGNYGHNDTKNLVNLDQWIQQHEQQTSTDVSELKSRVDNIWDVIYPIGAIYISTSNVNPEVLFGGTWAGFAQGRCIFGVDPSDSDFSLVRQNAGSKNLQQHSHTFKAVFDARNGSTGAKNIWGVTNTTVSQNTGESENGKVYISEATGKADRVTIEGSTGVTGIGNNENLPPYITCYIWERIN